MKHTAAVLFLIVSLALLFSSCSPLVPEEEKVDVLSAIPHEEERIPTSPYPIRPLLEQPDFSENLADFRRKNKDAVAWLYLPGTDICDEVVQAKDNEFYLRRSSEKEYYREHGCYFADFRNHMDKNDPPDKNTVIYGHNIWDDGTKFSQLLFYTDWNYFAQHPYIYLQTLDGLRVFRVAAAYYTLTDFKYIGINKSDRDWEKILKESVNRSLFITDLELPPDGRYLTLSTCCYKFRHSWGGLIKGQRFVILGVEIDPSAPPVYQLPKNNPDPFLI